MTKLLSSIVAAAIVSVVSFYADAKIPVTTLSDLVKASDCIVVGEVLEVKNGGVSKEYDMPSMVALVRPVNLIKGGAFSQFEIRYVPGLSEEPSFVAAKSYLLFLTRGTTGLQLVVGYLGARPIIDSQVATDEIKGEPKLQSVDSLLMKIRTLAAIKPQPHGD